MNSKILPASIVALALLGVAVAAYVIWVPATPDAAPGSENGAATTTATTTTTGRPPAAPVGKPTPGPAAPSPSSIVLAIGEQGGLSGVTIKPISVVEDSRCPANVQCFQAGTVKVNVTLSNNAGMISRQMQLGRAESIPGGQVVTLSAVAPAAFAGGTPKIENYRFTFTVRES